MLYNNAVTPDVCTHWQEHIHPDLLKEDTARPLPGFTCFSGALLQSAWAPTSCIRRIYRTEAAVVGWRA